MASATTPLNQTMTCVLNYVRENPGCTVREVREATGYVNTERMLVGLFARKLVGRQKGLTSYSPTRWYPEADL